MKKFTYAALLFSLVFILLLPGCKKKDKPMVDMNSINVDGSHNENYIFREEIEKEKIQEQKHREPGFK